MILIEICNTISVVLTVRPFFSLRSALLLPLLNIIVQQIVNCIRSFASSKVILYLKSRREQARVDVSINQTAESENI